MTKQEVWALANVCCLMHAPCAFLSLVLLLAGFFTQISTLADVQENVMEYLHVLSRPKVIDQEHDVVWTEAYIDSTVSLWEFCGRGWVCPYASGQGFHIILHQLWT
jgi:hypothetical protein